MMNDFYYEVKIPKERIAVLIGEKGSTKAYIEKKLKIILEIDSKEGDVTLKGEDSLNLMVGQDIVKAIGRGFNPRKAIKLIDEEYAFEIIDLTDLIGKSKNKLGVVRSRLIGTEGKARRNLEHLTETKLSIYGKTVAILGYYEDVALARRAIESLVAGSRHTTVYSWIEKQRRKQASGM